MKDVVVSARLMFRASRALSAMVMSAAVACTFDHSGLLPGSPPATDDATAQETGGAAGQPGTGGVGGASANTGGSSANDGGADLGPDGSSPDDGFDDGGGGREGSPEGDAPSPSVDSPPDGNIPPDDVAASDVASSGADGDGAAETDARKGCSAIPNAVAFTPPGALGPHCYWLHSTPSQWLGAANTCSSESGHLVTVSSSAETAFVAGLLTVFPSDERLWIGATDGRFSSDGPGSGPYTWITSEAMSYVNWYRDASTTEPNGLCDKCEDKPCYCEHRVAMRNDGRWEDDYEALAYRYVCESE